MLTPSNTLASVVRQTGLEGFADAITIKKPGRCDPHVQNHVQCDQLAAEFVHQQFLADAAAIGFALFAATVVGRIAVTFVGLVGLAVRCRRDWVMAKALNPQGTLQAGAIDG